ncbi:chondroitin proteoglycan-2-like [Limulus polyphemus]|uniref:Chondroitin proteoglycan-2-like n=1 Tax=Limulus polyphemus TaxID=6850 RepID=A0ABM1TST5_LIMPO|nr:chondroitin proteoglycan-2-like [Limulus polyphemus]
MTTTTTSQPPVIGPFDCPEPYGLFRDPYNCERFYHCSHGIPYRKWCPANLHFNEHLKVCDWPGNACCEKNKPCPKPTPEPTQPDKGCDCECCFFPDEKDCAAYTYCEKGVLYRRRCTDGLYFNPKIANCDHKSNVQCELDPKCPQPNGKFPIPGTSVYYILCINNIARREKCPEGLQFDPVTMCCTWPDTCNKTVTGLKPYLPKNECPCDCCAIPDPKDCTKFILCINGNAIKQTCADGLRFNPKIENCDYARNVDCDPPCDKDCDEKPTQPPGIHCKKPSGLFPHPDKCNLFIHCSHGIPHVKNCPSILHFNPNLRVCDWPWNAGSSHRYCSLARAVDLVGLVWMDLLEKTNISFTCNVKYDKLNLFICIKPTLTPTTKPGDCDCDGCFTPDPTDCASYYRCIDGIRVKYTCSPGLYFNRHTKKCDYKDNVSCYNFKCPSRNGMFKNKNDCGMFWHCSNYIPYLKECPSNLHWSVERQRCEWPCIAKCDPSVPRTLYSRGTDGSHLAKHGQSHLFVFSFQCNLGLQSLRFVVPFFTCTYITIFISSDDGCGKWIRDPVCTTLDGLFSKKDDCTKFYHCTNGIAYLKDCPASLYFNPLLKVCDWPRNVHNCGVDPGKAH